MVDRSVFALILFGSSSLFRKNSFYFYTFLWLREIRNCDLFLVKCILSTERRQTHGIFYSILFLSAPCRQPHNNAADGDDNDDDVSEWQVKKWRKIEKCEMIIALKVSDNGNNYKSKEMVWTPPAQWCQTILRHTSASFPHFKFENNLKRRNFWDWISLERNGTIRNVEALLNFASIWNVPTLEILTFSERFECFACATAESAC